MERIPTTVSMESLEGSLEKKIFSKFLNTDEDSYTGLQERFKANAGHGRICVHPLYTEQWPGTFREAGDGRELVEVQAMLRAAFFRTVESTYSNQDSSPLFVYEALKEIPKTKDVTASHIGVDAEDLSRVGIVFIPTERSSSALDELSIEEALSVGDEVDKDTAVECARLRNLMKLLDVDIDRPTREYLSAAQTYFSKINELENIFTKGLYDHAGLTSAVVSGGYMFTYGNPPRLGGCAGSLVSKLRDYGIKTDISKNVWPPRDKITEAGLPTKETGSS